MLVPYLKNSFDHQDQPFNKKNINYKHTLVEEFKALYVHPLEKLITTTSYFPHNSY